VARPNALDKALAAAADELSTELPTVAQSAVLDSNLALAKAQALVAKNMADLKKQRLVPIAMAPMYRPYFGNTMTISLNNLSIYLPLDGKTYHIPEAYARIAQGRRRRVDEHVMRIARLADVKSNFEREAGELALIPR